MYQHCGVHVMLFSESCKCLDCESSAHLVFFSCGGSVCDEIPRDTINFVLDLEIGEGLIIQPRVQRFDSNKWKRSFFRGVSSYVQGQVIFALANHRMNGSKYHVASNDCQQYVTILLKSIDKRLSEDLPRKFSETLLGQVTAGNCYGKKKLMDISKM